MSSEIQFEEGAKAEDAPDQTVTLDLNGCARCRGEGHTQITFTPLTFAVDKDGVEATHWAPCPTNGEPILMFFIAPGETQDVAPLPKDE